MNRKIVALALGAALVITGACSSDEPPAATSEEPPPTTYSPEDLKLVDIPVQKPAPGTKVDASQLPPELSNFAQVTGLTPDQQGCVNGAMKQAVDSDPSIPKAPGKTASLGGAAMAVCDVGTVFTDQLLQGLTGSDSDTKITPAQSNCLKAEFAANPQATGRVISGAMTMNAEVIQQTLAPFESKCGVELGASMGAG